MHAQAIEFMSLFSGDQTAYGTYDIEPENTTDQGKVLGRATTVKKQVTMDIWSDHLNGVKSLGIIPITQKSVVKFGAIDVDSYPINLESLYNNVTEAGLPLVVCRTKSGGAHLYLFLTEWTDAKFVQTKLKEYASFLGYGTSEIFPKQTKILVERGDIGQWINMPYFNTSDTNRYAVRDHGEPLSVVEFVEFANKQRRNEAQLKELKLSVKECLKDGPPCLNHLCSMGFAPGTRNNGLFNLGVYAKKSNPDKWREALEDYNNRFMDPPLSSTEVLGVIKSLDKKEFQYTCRSQPIVEHCNSSKCRTCKFGVSGGDAGLPKFGSLSKLMTDPPTWFLDIEGGTRIEMTTEELQSPIKFQLKCMATLNVMPPVMKRDEWTGVVQRLLSEVNVIESAEEGTPRGILLAHIEEFCTMRASGKTHDELLLGRVWTNNGRHYFRFRDLIAYLDRKRFKELELREITAYIRTFETTKHFFNIKGKGVNCYSIPEFKVQNKSLDIMKNDETVY